MSDIQNCVHVYTCTCLYINTLIGAQLISNKIGLRHKVTQIVKSGRGLENVNLCNLVKIDRIIKKITKKEDHVFFSDSDRINNECVKNIEFRLWKIINHG